MTAVRVIALSGGVGGAKLADGLYRALSVESLGVLVNGGDDFEHLGMQIAPDLDTVIYTLAGLADATRGWGRADEGWRFKAALSALGGPDWFQLGDADLAMHVWRTDRLRAGLSRGEVAASVASHLHIAASIWPMSNDAVATMIETDEGVLTFQQYFVARRCEPVVHDLRFEGADIATPNPDFLASLSHPQLEAVIICPSNPWLSIDPMLAVRGIRSGLQNATVPIVAVSPLVGGRAVKGPTAKIMSELGMPITSGAVAQHYAGLIDGFVIDSDDDDRDIDVPTLRTTTLMTDKLSRTRLAERVIEFAATLNSGGSA